MNRIPRKVLKKLGASVINLITDYRSLITTLAFALSGCMGVYEGGFECSPEKGAGCKSISEINEMINQCSSSMQCTSCKLLALSLQTGEDKPFSPTTDIWYSPWALKEMR